MSVPFAYRVWKSNSHAGFAEMSTSVEGDTRPSKRLHEAFMDKDHDEYSVLKFYPSGDCGGCLGSRSR